MTTPLAIALITAAPLFPGALIVLGIIAWAVFIYQPEAHDR